MNGRDAELIIILVWSVNMKEGDHGMANTEPSGKAEKALDRLRAIRDKAKDIKRIIRIIAECLAVVVGEARDRSSAKSQHPRAGDSVPPTDVHRPGTGRIGSGEPPSHG